MTSNNFWKPTLAITHSLHKLHFATAFYNMLSSISYMTSAVEIDSQFTSEATQTQSFIQPASQRRSARSPSISAIPEEAVMTTSNNSSPSESTDGTNPYEVSPDISTLTDLLNCEATRNDSRMRLWVQTRLMDLQLDLKRVRKARRSLPTIVLSPSEEGERELPL